MNKLLTFVVLSTLPLFVGCASTRDSSQSSIPNPHSIAIANSATSDLEARRAEVWEKIAAIQQEVELKAGLHMGVLIRDERGRLVELFEEAQAIEQELLRRSATARQNGGPQILKASL